MANRTIKFNIQALADTKGLDEFAKQLRELRGEAEPTDKVLGQAVKAVNDWAASQKRSASNTATATAAIKALAGAMTTGGNEWKTATNAVNRYNEALNQTVTAANAMRAAAAVPSKIARIEGGYIGDLRKQLQELKIGGQEYLSLLQQITEREQLLGRRTGRAGVVAANQAFEAATLTRGYGAAENLQAMPNTTAALRQRLSELAAEYPNVIRGSERYIQIATQMRVIESQLAKDLTGTTQALRQRSAATQAKIDAVRAYEQDARLAAFEASGNIVASRRQTAFGGVPQVVPGPDGTFIAPPYRTGRVSLNTNQYVQPIGPITAQEYSNRFTQYGQSIGPQPTALFQTTAGIASAGAEARLQTIGRSYEQVASQIRQTSAAAGRSTAVLEAEKAAWDQLARSVDRGTREYKLASAESRRIDRQLGGRGRFSGLVEGAGAISAGAFFGGPEGLLGGVVGSFMGPGGALAGASAGAQVGIVRKSVAETATYAAELGKLRIALRGVTGGSEEYARSLRIVNEVSTALNVSQTESLQGFTRLTAAVIGAGGKVSDAEVVFKGVSSAIKASGGSAEDVQSALLAMSQVFSKGKVSAEELQGQLGERLPGAVTLFAAATNRTLPQLAKDLRDGTVGLNDLMQFAESLSSKYAEKALLIARSTEDSGARQEVALQRLREEFGKTIMPLGASLQQAATGWINFGTSVVTTINGISTALEGLRKQSPVVNALANLYGLIGKGALNAIPGGGLLNTVSGLPGVGQAMGRNSPTERLVRAGSTTMYSDASGNVYDTATGKMILSAGRGTTNFADPKNNNTADKAKAQREKAERDAREAAARQQRLDMQLYNDRVRLEEQLAENRIRLEDRVFEYKQELMRRERDAQARLDDLRLQNFINRFGPEGRSALGPLAYLIRGGKDNSSQIAEQERQVEAARQRLNSARQMEVVRQQFGAKYRTEDATAAVTGMPTSDTGAALIRAANQNLGLFAGQTERCADAIRRLFEVAGVAIGTTRKAWDGLASGRSLASSFFGSDIGQRINRREDLRPGDLVGFERTYGSWGPGVQTHVGLYAGDGMMYDHSSRRGLVRRPLDTFAGKFMYGVRPYAVGGALSTTTLATGQTVRTTGAAAAALRGAGAAGDVMQAQADLKQEEALLAQLKGQQGPLAKEQLIAAQLAMTQGLRDQTQAVRDNADDWRLRNRLELEGVKPEIIDFELQKAKILREQGRAIEAQAQALEANKDLLGPERYKAIADSIERQRQSVSGLVSEYEALAKAQSDPRLLLQRKIAQLDSSLRDFTDTQKLAVGMSDELQNALSGGFTNSVNSIVTGSSTIQQSLGNMFLNIGNMFLEMVARMLATSATRSILQLLNPGPAGAIGGGPGPAGAIGGGLPGFSVSGDSVGSIFSGAGPVDFAKYVDFAKAIKFAKGGIAAGPREGYPAMLHGTEAVVPLPNGRAIPVEMRGGSGTSVVVNVNMSTGQTDVQSTEGDGKLLGEALSQAVQAELIRQKRPGGILYK